MFTINFTGGLQARDHYALDQHLFIYYLLFFDEQNC